MKKTAWLAFCFLGLVWGSNFIFVEWAAEYITPAQITLLRVVFGFLPVFLFAAAFGVLRFPDPLLRMHASTKAGTVGAMFVVAGAIAAQPDSGRIFVGAVAIGFLLLTVPVAAHLLGRAAYISGARLTGLAGHDALFGKITRKIAPLEERDEVAGAPAQHASETSDKG